MNAPSRIPAARPALRPHAPLVFLPGLFMTSAAWEPLCSSLNLTNRLMLDLPGHRPGERAADVAQALRDQTWLDDLVKRIDSFAGGRKVHLIGHSTGGLVSLLLAQKKPELVRSMILVGAPVTGQRDRERDTCAAVFSNDLIGRISWTLLWPLWLSTRTTFQRGMASVSTVDAASHTPDALRQSLRRCDPEAIRQFGKWVLEQDVTGIMSAIKQPCLAIIGREDKVVSAQHQLKLLQHLPNAQAQVVRGGHLPFLENQVHTGRLLRGWMAIQQTR